MINLGIYYIVVVTVDHSGLVIESVSSVRCLRAVVCVSNLLYTNFMISVVSLRHLKTVIVEVYLLLAIIDANVKKHVFC